MLCIYIYIILYTCILLHCSCDNQFFHTIERNVWVQFVHSRASELWASFQSWSGRFFSVGTSTSGRHRVASLRRIIPKKKGFYYIYSVYACLPKFASDSPGTIQFSLCYPIKHDKRNVTDVWRFLVSLYQDVQVVVIQNTPSCSYFHRCVWMGFEGDCMYITHIPVFCMHVNIRHIL